MVETETPTNLYIKALKDCSKEIGCFPKASPTTVCGAHTMLHSPNNAVNKLQNCPHPYQSHRSLGSRTTNLSNITVRLSLPLNLLEYDTLVCMGCVVSYPIV